MSDGLDPRRGPYRGRRPPDLDEWCEEFVMTLASRGYLREGKPSAILRTLQETRELVRAVVKATRDGHFQEEA